MNDLIKQYFPVFIPFIFIPMWFCISTLLGYFSGWYSLMHRFPDRPEKELLKLKNQSGTMGLLVGMNKILTISVCQSGLRLEIMRIFGIFCRNFLVPWEEVEVKRKNWLFWERAELRFGKTPCIGKLSIPYYVANRLARSAENYWPEPGPFPDETKQQAFTSVSKEWAVVTFLVSTFFTVAPKIVAPQAKQPPIAAALLFPAVIFGVIAIVRYFSRIKK